MTSMEKPYRRSRSTTKICRLWRPCRPLSRQKLTPLPPVGTRFKDGETEAVSKLAMDVTMAGVHPDVPVDHASNKHLSKEQKKEYPALAAQYEALSNDAKWVYADARDKMKRDWEARGNVYADIVTLAYADIIADAKTPEEKVKQTEARDAAIEKNKEVIAGLKGPYFPLMRFGKYLTILKSKKLVDLEAKLEEATKSERVDISKKLEILKRSPTDYKVASYTSEIQAANAFEAAEKEGNWYMPEAKEEGGSYMKLADAADPKQREITKLGMDKVKAYLTDNIDPGTAAQLKTMLAELYVGSLPGKITHWRVSYVAKVLKVPTPTCSEPSLPALRRCHSTCPA